MGPKWAIQFLENCFLVLLTVILILSAPLLLTLCLPIFLLRVSLQISRGAFGLDAIVSGRDSIFAADDIYGAPRGSLVVRIRLEGRADLAEFRNSVMEKIVIKKGRNGELLYPELQQFVVKFSGFYFRKWEADFEIGEHVRLGREFQEGTHEELIRKGYKVGRSPWEFLLFHTEGETTEWIARFHHCLADGFSILKILMEDLSDVSLDAHRRINRSVTKTRSPIWDPRKLLSLWSIPYEQVKQRYYTRDRNLLHSPGRKLNRKYHLLHSDFINVDYIKGIKNKFENASFTSVILAGIASGLRHYFEVTGEGIGAGRDPIPEVTHLICPIPVGIDADSLGNHWTFSFLPLPTGEGNATKRLEKINQALSSFRKSSLSAVNYALIPPVGWLTSGLMSLLSRNTFSTGIASIFPGPVQAIHTCGHAVKEMSFAGGLFHGDQGLCFTVLSYSNKFKILLTVDTALMSLDEAQRMLRRINEAISTLNEETVVPFKPQL